MVPPKTMAISQQQQVSLSVGQQSSAAGVGGGDMKQNTVKPRKRKGKQQQQQQHQSNERSTDHVQKSAAEQPSAKNTTINKHENVVDTSSPQKPGAVALDRPNDSSTNNKTTNPAVVPIERTTLNKSQQNKQAKNPEPVKKQDTSSGVRRVVQAVVVDTQVIGKHKQIVSAEEADDIDAGIELDGSSNSGSSVKDIGDDQKSASVSPVMAPQTTGSLASESFESHCSNVTKQTAEVIPIEKLNGSVCTAAKPLLTQTPSTEEPQKVKKSLSLATKLQLAANQQVIDADEQQLQRRLQNKQKKLVSQDSGASLDDNQVPENETIGSKKAQTTTDVTNQANNSTTTTKAKPRRFSSQSSQESGETSSCKVCGQHVYQMEKMLAEKSIYHKRCFRCYQCKIQLRVDNYSSHEGQVYCKAHHRQIFQPQVKLDNGNDVDIVAKSTTNNVDDYLLHRGRLSELSFSFLQPKPQGNKSNPIEAYKHSPASKSNQVKTLASQSNLESSHISHESTELLKRQMIICENEPAELPKDVVRCETKLDDGIDNLKLNLNNILEKFERGNASGEDSTPSSAGLVIDKPSFNIKKTLMAFESKSNEPEERNERTTEKPVVKKLANLNGFFKQQQNNQDNEIPASPRPLPVKRSGSLMMRLKKYESRIAGEQVDDDQDSSDDENNNSDETKANKTTSSINDVTSRHGRSRAKVGSLNLKSLKNQWENGEISKKRNDDDASDEDCLSPAASDKIDGEKSEELIRIRQQLARKKSSDSTSVKNIYENAIKEAQLQQQALRRESSDLSALNGFSTTNIQQKLLQRTESSLQKSTTPNKDHFQLNSSNRANKLRERFELGLINNSSRDDTDQSDNDEEAPISKLEQIRQEKMEDLSIFTEGEIKAREARSMFQQIDRSISAANGGGRQPVVNSRSLASVQDAMRSKLTSRMSTAQTNSQPQQQDNHHHEPQDQLENRPIRLTNNYFGYS